MRLRNVLVSAAFFAALSPGICGADPSPAPATPVASATPEQSAVPPGIKIHVSGENVDATALVRSQFAAWQAGAVDPAPYSTKGAATLKGLVDQTSANLKQAGSVQQVQYLAKGQAHGGGLDGDFVYLYELTCEHGIVHAMLTLSSDGKIDLLSFKGP